jgi:uncharacterized membrane protein YfcA
MRDILAVTARACANAPLARAVAPLAHSTTSLAWSARARSCPSRRQRPGRCDPDSLARRVNPQDRSLDYALILIVGLVAGTLGGIVGFGSSIMLMPVLVLTFGPREAVPIMAIGAVMANLSRVLAWWREIDWRAAAAYAVTAVPGAALGARTLLVLPPRIIEVALGLFFIAMVPVGRVLAARQWRLRRVHLALVGFFVGFLTGIVVSTGPITVPVFLAYGLTRGAFIATEAAGSLAVYLAKAAVFRGFGALPLDIFAKGLIVGSSLMAGAFIARRFVLAMSPRQFRRVMDALLLGSGASLLWVALR